MLPPQKNRHILDLSREEKKAFLDSFDFVFSDCDGVIWLCDSLIPGVATPINQLKSAGKSVKFISNNSLRSDEAYEATFAKIGVEDVCAATDVVHPVSTIESYLKENDKYKRIFSITCDLAEKRLSDSGFDVVTMDIEKYDSLHSLVAKIEPQDKVDAVVMDFDLNFHFAKVLLAQQYLNHPDCDLIVGATDSHIPIKKSLTILGYASYIKALSEITGKEPIVLGKPGSKLGECLQRKFDITDPKRVLFIGDSMVQDIEFALSCGYQALFVLSGTGTKEQMLGQPDELKPDFYADSLLDFNDFFKDLI